jgi:hypothetical protein
MAKREMSTHPMPHSAYPPSLSPTTLIAKTVATTGSSSDSGVTLLAERFLNAVVMAVQAMTMGPITR